MRSGRDAARRSRSDRAMTLMDVLVAIALLSFGGTGLLSVELSLIAANARARQLTTATCVARAEMERLMYGTTVAQSGTDTVDSFGCGSGRACVQQGTIFTRTWTVGTGSPTPLLVSVSFQEASGRQHGVVIHGLR